MIDPLSTLAGLPGPAESKAPHKVLRMVSNDRTAGSMPMWVREDTPVQVAEKTSPIKPASLTESESTATYALLEPGVIEEEPEFGFGDLLDMVNPLQHIPLIGHFYRKITGDDIRPISQIIGGGIFAGPLGAAGGIANAIVLQETGRDVTDNALAFLGGESDEKPAMRYAEKPQTGLYDLPGNLLAFTDLKSDPQITIARLTDQKDDQSLV